MQRIWIAGPSGSGKTTLANKLGAKLDIPVYHRDQITWKENWQHRSEEEQIELAKEISKKDKWIFEGNRFTSARKDGRFERCDTIIYLNINRFICLYSGYRRYLKHRGTVRPDLSEGCIEQFDMELIKYILLEYPRKKNDREAIFVDAKEAGKRLIILNGRSSVNRFLEQVGQSNIFHKK